jgi:hypothetical protein
VPVPLVGGSFDDRGLAGRLVLILELLEQIEFFRFFYSQISLFSIQQGSVG